MRRRQFLSIGVAVTFARSVYADGKAKLPVVGLLIHIKEDTELARQRVAVLRQGLADEGLAEGTHYSLVKRFLEGDYSRVGSVVQELVAFKPRVLVIGTIGITATRKLYSLTSQSFSLALLRIQSRWDWPRVTCVQVV